MSRVEAVDLEKVDDVDAQACQRGVDLFEDGLAGQPGPSGAGLHQPVDLGRQDDLLAAGVLLQRPSDDLLRGAMGYTCAVSQKVIAPSFGAQDRDRVAGGAFPVGVELARARVQEGEPGRVRWPRRAVENRCIERAIQAVHGNEVARPLRTPQVR